MSESKIMSKSYNGIYNSSQGVYEPTETHLKSTAGNRIMSQEIRSLKFSIKSFLNRCILCPHKPGYIDVLNQNLQISPMILWVMALISLNRLLVH